MTEPDRREEEKRGDVPDGRGGKDRRRGADRRAGVDRRAAADRRTGLGRRTTDITEHRGVERCINEYPMSEDELEFIRAINEYKLRYGKPFPSWSEILHILKSLGYHRPGSPSA